MAFGIIFYWEDGTLGPLLDLARETVRRILESKMLRGEQIVTIYPICGGHLDLKRVEG